MILLEQELDKIISEYRQLTQDYNTNKARYDELLE